MTAKRILIALALMVLTALSTMTLRGQTEASAAEKAEHLTSAAGQGGFLDTLERIKEAQSQQLEGSWIVTVTPLVPPGVPQPPAFRAHATVARGGAFFGSDRTRPFSKQHGSWAHIRGNDFAWTVTEDLFDGMGNFAGTIKVRARLTVTGKDEFTGFSNGEARDAAGNLIFNRCATLRGERIKVEPLPEQCQPPQ